ncbi:MAG: hypothetical protein EOO29_24940, partial [Comamonadaceae bacterium]
MSPPTLSPGALAAALPAGLPIDADRHEPTTSLTAHDADANRPRLAWQRLRAHKLAVFSLGWIVLALLLAVLAPWIAPYD